MSMICSLYLFIRTLDKFTKGVDIHLYIPELFLPSPRLSSWITQFGDHSNAVSLPNPCQGVAI